MAWLQAGNGAGNSMAIPLPLEYLALEEAENALTHAEWDLNFTEADTSLFFANTFHTDFPDPGPAKLNLEEAIMWYGAVGEYGAVSDEEFFGMMEESTQSIMDELPDGVELRTYEGKAVDAETFRAQREEISKLREWTSSHKELYKEAIEGQEKLGNPIIPSSFVIMLGGALIAIRGIAISRPREESEVRSSTEEPEE